MIGSSSSSTEGSVNEADALGEGEGTGAETETGVAEGSGVGTGLSTAVAEEPLLVPEEAGSGVESVLSGAEGTTEGETDGVGRSSSAITTVPEEPKGEELGEKAVPDDSSERMTADSVTVSSVRRRYRAEIYPVSPL